MNAYPNADNYLSPSFNDTVIAPSVDPDEGALIAVAYNPAWQKILLGAATQMLQYAAYAGTDDEKKLAVARATTLMVLLQNDISSVGTPFWDDESDVDDQEPVATQPWYGEVTNPEAPAGELDFVENVALWIVTGLVAIATFEVGGVAPALAFHTTVEKFIILQKRGDAAATIRFVVDGEDAKFVNTAPYAPGDIIETQIITEQTGGDHTLLIVQTE